VYTISKPGYTTEKWYTKGIQLRAVIHRNVLPAFTHCYVCHYHSGVLGPIVASVMRLFQSCVRPIVRYFSFCLNIASSGV